MAKGNARHHIKGDKLCRTFCISDRIIYCKEINQYWLDYLKHHVVNRLFLAVKGEKQ